MPAIQFVIVVAMVVVAMAGLGALALLRAPRKDIPAVLDSLARMIRALFGRP